MLKKIVTGPGGPGSGAEDAAANFKVSHLNGNLYSFVAPNHFVSNFVNVANLKRKNKNLKT